MCCSRRLRFALLAGATLSLAGGVLAAESGWLDGGAQIGLAAVSTAMLAGLVRSLALLRAAPPEERAPGAATLNGALLYLMLGNAERAPHLRAAMRSVHKHYARAHNYTFVVLTDDAPALEAALRAFPARVKVARVDASEWALPDNARGAPETFYLGNFSAGFSLKYRQMSRYAAGPMFLHPALDEFDYVLKLDDDALATGAWAGDPLRCLASGGKFGYWMFLEDFPGVVVGLGDALRAFLARERLALRHPEWVFRRDGSYRGSYFYGAAFAFRVRAMRDGSLHRLWRDLDATAGWFFHRWDEQKVLLFHAALTMASEEVCFMSELRVSHGRKWVTDAAKVRRMAPDEGVRIWAGEPASGGAKWAAEEAVRGGMSERGAHRPRRRRRRRRRRLSEAR